VCGASEQTDKIVEVITSEASAYEAGESVEVALMRNDMGPKSVILAYVVPFFVLTIALVGALAVGASEGIAVVAALAGVAVWYVVLYALRSKIKDRIKFIIIKQTK
jgi:sigma-E factor negative regulatory protein RseC